MLCFALFTGAVAPISADRFGDRANNFSMDFVEISPGDVSDDTGRGAVNSEYRIGKYEVSTTMIDVYNALSGGPTLVLREDYGPNHPAISLTWNETARFVNWLNTSTGYPPAYKFTTDGARDDIALWYPTDVGFDPDNFFRNSQAKYFLPSEGEWYRAAYYDPVAERYWNFATGSDEAPGKVASGTAPGTAVWDHSASGPAEVTSAGGLSPFGTMAQSGNVYEWMESASSPPNDIPGKSRSVRGGMWGDRSAIALSVSLRLSDRPSRTGKSYGFRVASREPLPPAPPLKLALEIVSISDSFLLVEVGNIPETAQVFHLRQSTDGEDFQPLSPALDFDHTTRQPFVVLRAAEPEPVLLLQVFEGSTPSP